MQLGLQITEKEYRQLPYPSYSLLSGLSKGGPIAMYGEKEDISDFDSIIIGSIVDALITEGHPPDNMVIIDKKPSNKALAIIKALSRRTDLPDTYLLSVKNKTQIKEECDSLEYYKNASTEQRIKHLKKYTKYVKAISKHGDDAMIISSYQWSEANELVKNILHRFPFLLEPNVIGQVKIVGKIDGFEIKGMLDFIVVDDENKVIHPFDLKTGIGSHNTFFDRGFINWRYYLQSSLYKELLAQAIIGTKYEDYKINNFRFLFCGRDDRLPIIYVVTDKWHKAGLNGFTYKNQYHPGVYEMLEDYQYYLEHPNALYRKGYDSTEVEFKDNLCELNVNGK